MILSRYFYSLQIWSKSLIWISCHRNIRAKDSLKKYSKSVSEKASWRGKGEGGVGGGVKLKYCIQAHGISFYNMNYVSYHCFPCGFIVMAT